jgi:transcriptional regulator with XRE-family HTH domain
MPDKDQKSSQSGSEESIDARLRRLQSEHGWSLQQVADRTGLSKSSVQNYMRKNDPQKPGVDALIALASGLDVSTDWLLGISNTRDRSGPSGHQLSLVELSAKLVIEQFIAHLNVTNTHLGDVEGFTLFRKGMLFGVEPEVLAADYAYRVMKLFSDLQSGVIDRDNVRLSYDTDGSDALNLDPPKLQLRSSD